MSPHEHAVRALLDVLSVHPGGGWSWFGRRVDPPPSDLGTGPAQRVAAILRLRERLYGCFYTTGSPVPAGPGARRTPDGPSAFAASLAAANAGRVSRQPGWRIVAVDGDEVLVEQDGLRARARAREIVDLTGETLAVGASVEAFLPSVVESAQPGFLVALGERTLGHDSGEPIDRFYWHVRSRGASQLLADLSTALNRARVPFRLKLLAEPRAYWRCDAAVLYVSRRQRESVSAIAEEVRGRVAAHLGRATPALTHRLADGLALAEEPPGGESFGGHRCGLLAEALISAAGHGVADPDARLDHIRDRLGRARIDLDAPWRSGAPA